MRRHEATRGTVREELSIRDREPAAFNCPIEFSIEPSASRVASLRGERSIDALIPGAPRATLNPTDIVAAPRTAARERSLRTHRAVPRGFGPPFDGVPARRRSGAQTPHASFAVARACGVAVHPATAWRSRPGSFKSCAIVQQGEQPRCATDAFGDREKGGLVGIGRRRSVRAAAARPARAGPCGRRLSCAPRCPRRASCGQSDSAADGSFPRALAIR